MTKKEFRCRREIKTLNINKVLIIIFLCFLAGIQTSNAINIGLTVTGGGGTASFHDATMAGMDTTGYQKTVGYNNPAIITEGRMVKIGSKILDLTATSNSGSTATAANSVTNGDISNKMSAAVNSNGASATQNIALTGSAGIVETYAGKSDGPSAYVGVGTDSNLNAQQTATLNVQQNAAIFEQLQTGYMLPALIFPSQNTIQMQKGKPLAIAHSEGSHTGTWISLSSQISGHYWGLTQGGVAFNRALSSQSSNGEQIIAKTETGNSNTNQDSSNDVVINNAGDVTTDTIQNIDVHVTYPIGYNIDQIASNNVVTEGATIYQRITQNAIAIENQFSGDQVINNALLPDGFGSSFGDAAAQ